MIIFKKYNVERQKRQETRYNRVSVYVGGEGGGKTTIGVNKIVYQQIWALF